VNKLARVAAKNSPPSLGSMGMFTFPSRHAELGRPKKGEMNNAPSTAKLQFTTAFTEIFLYRNI